MFNSSRARQPNRLCRSLDSAPRISSNLIVGSKSLASTSKRVGLGGSVPLDRGGMQANVHQAKMSEGQGSGIPRWSRWGRAGQIHSGSSWPRSSPQSIGSRGAIQDLGGRDTKIRAGRGARTTQCGRRPEQRIRSGPGRSRPRTRCAGGCGRRCGQEISVLRSRHALGTC